MALGGMVAAFAAALFVSHAPYKCEQAVDQLTILWANAVGIKRPGAERRRERGASRSRQGRRELPPAGGVPRPEGLCEPALVAGEPFHDGSEGNGDVGAGCTRMYRDVLQDGFGS
jgi:hypothetical protein